MSATKATLRAAPAIDLAGQLAALMFEDYEPWDRWFENRVYQPTLGRLPVVILTSSREMTDIKRAYELGANSYLVKPGSPDELLQIVRTLGMYWLVFNEPPATLE